ncbi:MAG: hypothetical protein ACRDHN_17600 [Thermomicrobiales bacterium]
MADRLYIRAGNDVLIVDETADMDFDGDSRAQPFDGIIQWPWLDLGEPGVNKRIAGMDIATMRANSVAVEFGYDQTDKFAFTPSYEIPGDTMPGAFIPFPLVAPSFSVRLTLSSLDHWQFQSITVYLIDNRMTS